MKQIYVTDNEIDLQMLVGLLENAGIHARIIADGAGDYFRKLGSDLTIRKRVVVSESDWSKAILLMRENGFCTSETPKRSRAEITVARVALVVMVILMLIFFFL